MDKVIVKIIGSQTDGTGEVNRIELVAEGRHYYRNGKHYVLYDDTMTNTEEKTATVLKIAADSLTLLRQGGHDGQGDQDRDEEEASHGP